MHGRARAERVTALASDGVATARLATGVATEDTITLAVTWRNRSGDGDGGGGGAYDGATGHATYTASWIAPKADVHSQQRWFYMGQAGELTVDQAHRGYSTATDAAGFGAVNPLFWKPTRSASTGEFAGQRCYGYLSFEAFVDAAAACNGGEPAEFDGALPTLATPPTPPRSSRRAPLAWTPAAGRSSWCTRARRARRRLASAPCSSCVCRVGG